MNENYFIIFQSNGYVSGYCWVEPNEPYDYYGDLSAFPDLIEGWYIFTGNDFVVDEEKKAEIIERRKEEALIPTEHDREEAQLYYTAMMTGTLIDEEEEA